MIPYGVMSKDQLSKLATPSMAYILKDIVGPWGAAFIDTRFNNFNFWCMVILDDATI